MSARDTWAVVPVKRLDQAKQRLAGCLSDAERAALSLAMLDDVLSALSDSPGLAGLIVVTADREVRDRAKGYGSRALEEPGPSGLTAAVAAAAAALAREKRQAMLFLPADIPQVTTESIAQLLNAVTAGRKIVLVPAHDGLGTNAIYSAPPGAIDPDFGLGSFQRHVAAAQLRGITPLILRDARLGHDVDEPRDLLHLLQSDHGAPHTRRFLEQSGVAGRLLAPLGQPSLGRAAMARG